MSTIETIINAFKKGLICVLLIASSTGAKAYVTEFTTNSFADIQAIYEKEVVTPEKTLLVFDIDNTLMTMSQDLGGVGWWEWQNRLLINEPNSEKLIVRNREEFIKVQNILFNIIKMDVTDKFVLPLLNKALSQKSSLMALTARGHEHLSITLAQFKENDFYNSKNQLLFKAGHVELKPGFADMDGELNCTQFKEQVIYHQGIVFLKGEDKGEALRCIIAHAKKTYDTVFFVDDALYNNVSMTRAFVNEPNIRVFNVLFNGEHPKEALFSNSTSLQNRTELEWKAIRKTFQNNIQYSRLKPFD